MAVAVSLSAISGNCLAWIRGDVKTAYEEKFGDYVNDKCGLRAIALLLGGHGINLTEKQIQTYLEDNYEEFKAKFEAIDMEALEAKCNELNGQFGKGYRRSGSKGVYSLSPSAGDEQKRKAKYLDGFDAEACWLTPILRRIFGENLFHKGLLTQAEESAKNHNIVLPRLAKRDKSCLIKWYSENWKDIEEDLNQKFKKFAV